VTEVVLDASALIALLRDEQGADKVADIVASARMSVVNYAEVVSHFVHAGMPEREVDAMLDPLPIEWVAMDKELARYAGRLRTMTSHAGLSLGDRACLALAGQMGLPAWTADRSWGSIADTVGVDIALIR
jgi:PIN domain nuclease of toxin-antitoxin system